MAKHYELAEEDGNVLDVFADLEGALAYMRNTRGEPTLGEVLPHFSMGTFQTARFQNSPEVLYLHHLEEDAES